MIIRYHTDAIKPKAKQHDGDYITIAEITLDLPLWAAVRTD